MMWKILAIGALAWAIVATVIALAYGAAVHRIDDMDYD